MMPESTLRTKERFSVTLNATYGIKGEGLHNQECQIANLSSHGAKVRFPGTESPTTGAVIVMDIAIPNNVMRIAAEAEIMWTRQRFNEFISGIRFTGALNDAMVQQVVNTVPQLHDYTELIW
ncbi:MAG: PilZ domain-containing protein [Deltaproteobacteria bacterium]|nr:PilZ domain-containing protein [Deltaproteobacteria bacterium]